MAGVPAGALRIQRWLTSTAPRAPIATADSTTTLKDTLAGKKTLLLFVRNFA